ncbi:carbohydrate ABC transporter permease [Nonomuraea sp. WAC 01424]|uniref:carbohydrate ABC transporter permease n=1 Tax=Nonomuraea sp. WAC 01424 TaxID=2203200 RepID=UPI0021AE140A|nr:carbohydrate ABC transporter permease [Nonomuraea sp. WAC 01424]
MSRTRRTDLVAGGVLAVLAFAGLFPYLFMLAASVKDNEQFFASYWSPAWPLHLDNYAAAWEQVSPYLFTSFVVAVLAIAGTMVLAPAAAFVFARYRFPGRGVLFGMVAALLMVPSITSLIPLFVLMRDLGILDSRLVLIIPHVTANTVFGIVVMRTYMAQIPEEMFEAARVDGAGGVRLFLAFMLPLARPVIGTVALMTVLGVWNDYFWPLLTVQTDTYRTIPAGLAFFANQNAQQWGPLFAGYVLASLPLVVLFTFLSKWFLAGIQGGIVSGK